MPVIIKYLDRNKWTLLSIAILVPLGFYTKVYSGPAAGWVNNSLGGVLYVIFWSLVFSLLFTRTREWKIAGMVFLATCILEFMQLWHPPFLESVRSTFLGVTLIGNSFSWLDMVHYAIGSTLSLLLLRFLSHHDSMV